MILREASRGLGVVLTCLGLLRQLANVLNWFSSLDNLYVYIKKIGGIDETYYYIVDEVCNPSTKRRE